MSNISKYAVAQTSRLLLLDANDQQMYADDADGKPDPSKPMAVNLYSPGSRQYAQASNARQNRQVDLLKNKGKTKETVEEAAREQAEFLAACTESFENITDGDLTGPALFKAVYADREIGFVAEQVGVYLRDWGNFTKGSTKP